MKNVKMLRKGIFPLRPLTVNINGKDYKLKGNGEITVTIPEKELDVVMKMDFWKSTKAVKLEDDKNNIVIEHKFPDIFFILGLLLLFVIAPLTFFGMLSPIVLSAFLLAYVLPQIYYGLLKSNEYFKIRVV